MLNSDRATLFIFLTILAIIFGFLFYIFGGDSQNPINHAQNTYIEDDMLDEDDLEDDLEHNQRRYNPRLSNSFDASSDQNSSSDNEPGSESDVGYKSRSSSGFSGSGSSSSKSNTGRKRRKQTAFFKELYRKPKTKSPEEKRQKIRDRLKKRGFTNLDYIEMKALAATNNEASQALKSAASFANQDNPAKAIEILEEQLDNLDPKDIKTRGKIQNALIMIYSNFGYPDKWQEMVHQMVATRRRILAVQKNTILANDPRSQDVFQEQEMLLNKDLAKALDGLPNFIEEMIKHKGLPPEMQNGAKAAFVTASNSSNGALSIKDINQSYKSIEARRSKHWANPK